jgi:hypothetical protein
MAEVNDTPANGAVITVGGHDAEHITDAIIEAAARQLLNGTSFDEDGEPYSYRNDLAQRLERKVGDLIANFAAEQAEPILRAALEKPIPRVNRYGETASGTRTLAEAIAEEVHAALIAPARDGYGSQNKRAILNGLIEEKVNDVLRADFSKQLEDARAKVRKAVNDKAAELLAAESLRQVGIR